MSYLQSLPEPLHQQVFKYHFTNRVLKEFFDVQKHAWFRRALVAEIEANARYLQKRRRPLCHCTFTLVLFPAPKFLFSAKRYTPGWNPLLKPIECKHFKFNKPREVVEELTDYEKNMFTS
jgi:hypothetical protein